MPIPKDFTISPAIPEHFSAPLTPPPENTIYLASGLIFSQQGPSLSSSPTVSSTNSPLRVLLIKRAPSVHYPLDNKWDFPGGGIEFGIPSPSSTSPPISTYDPPAEGEADGSIIHAAVREVHEETGLHATNVAAYIGADSWVTGSSSSKSGKKTVVKFYFLVEVQEFEGATSGDEWEKVAVKLMAEEHTEFVWAKEDEVEGFTFISQEQMEMAIKAFEKWRELRISNA